MKRNHEIKVRLNDDEFNDLNGKLLKVNLAEKNISDVVFQNH